MLLRAILSWFYGKPGEIVCFSLPASSKKKKTLASVCQLKDKIREKKQQQQLKLENNQSFNLDFAWIIRFDLVSAMAGGCAINIFVQFVQ